MLNLDSYSASTLQTVAALLKSATAARVGLDEIIEAIDTRTGSVSAPTEGSEQLNLCRWCGKPMYRCPQASALVGKPVYVCLAKCGYSMIVGGR